MRVCLKSPLKKRLKNLGDFKQYGDFLNYINHDQAEV